MGSTLYSHEELIAIMQQSGWGYVGGRKELYARFASMVEEHGCSRMGGFRDTIVIPLDRTGSDYDELMGIAVHNMHRFGLIPYGL